MNITIEKIKWFPKEIINKILEYQGFHCWRNGKYMCQIGMCDPRREMLLTRNKKYFPRVEKNEFQSSVYISKETAIYSSYSVIIQILIISLGGEVLNEEVLNEEVLNEEVLNEDNANTIVLWIMNTDKIQWNKKVVQTRVQYLIH